MTILLHRIAELEQRVLVLSRQLREMRRSRDLWKHRAMSYGRGGAGQGRRAA